LRKYTEIKKYQRANKYDYNWIAENWMGPNPLYLAEELCGNMDLRPGMKVLDMGCGKGCSAVFLAKEYGVTVFAVDLWIKPTDNQRRFEEMGVADRVYPIRAEAHALPFAEGFFDAAVSFNSYHYYGTADTYFPQTYSKLVKSGGQFGVVIDGYINEDEYCDGADGFHSGKWWRRHWEKTRLVKITACYDFDDWKSADEEMYADNNFDTSNFALIVMSAIKK
jgi:cyclopropane fatty-acyl-phospholipid synthase-like methyltransferase